MKKMDYGNLFATVFLIGLISFGLLYTVRSCQFFEKDRQRREQESIDIDPSSHEPILDYPVVSEIGYIEEREVSNLFTERKRITWVVKIPTTGMLYQCDWEFGFPGFEVNDGVRLVFDPHDIKDKEVFYGHLVRLLGKDRDKAAFVSVLKCPDEVR
jgi:hypothetical protein